MLLSRGVEGCSDVYFKWLLLMVDEGIQGYGGTSVARILAAAATYCGLHCKAQAAPTHSLSLTLNPPSKHCKH